MAESPEQICNLAVAKLGHENFISSLTEESKAARVFNVLYVPIRDYVLRSHLWKFARKRAVLSPLSAGPAFDEGNYFQIPEDCLRVVGTDEDYRKNYGTWRVDGGKIIAETEVLNLVYITSGVNVALFDPMFVDAFACKLAHEGSMPITKDSGLKDRMLQEYNRSVIKAASVNATEASADAFISEMFIGAR